MPTQDLSSTTPDKSSANADANKRSGISDETTHARASEGAAKIVDGAHEISSATTSAAAEKARQVRDQVEATASTTQAKVTSLKHEASAAAKHATDRVESSARSVVAGAKDALSEVTAEASELLHEARDVALESYDSARDYALEVIDEASDLAQQAGERSVSFLQRTGRATGKFVSLHALPLAATGASLGWLLMSMRTRGGRSSKTVPMRRNEVQVRRPRLNELEGGRPTQHEIEVTRPLDVRASREAYPATGAKPMGVRRHDNPYGL